MILAWLKRRKQQPRPIARPDGYAIAGEQWCGYIPPEPMTHQQAEACRVARNRMESDRRWRDTVLGARNRMTGATTCVTNGLTLFCVAHGRVITACLAVRP